MKSLRIAGLVLWLTGRVGTLTQHIAGAPYVCTLKRPRDQIEIAFKQSTDVRVRSDKAEVGTEQHGHHGPNFVSVDHIPNHLAMSYPGHTQVTDKLFV